MDSDFVTVTDLLAQPEPFFRRGSDEPVFWGCGKCRRVYSIEKEARHCRSCAPSACATCGARKKPGSYCKPCTYARREAKERAAFAAATKIQEVDYSDPVIYNGDFYHSVESMRDSLEEGDDDPEYVWACKRHRPTIDPNWILQLADENGPGFDGCDGIEWDNREQFVNMVNTWFAQQSFYWWEEDNSCAVVLSPEGAAPAPSAAGGMAEHKVTKKILKDMVERCEGLTGAYLKEVAHRVKVHGVKTYRGEIKSVAEAAPKLTRRAKANARGKLRSRHRKRRKTVWEKRHEELALKNEALEAKLEAAQLKLKARKK